MRLLSVVLILPLFHLYVCTLYIGGWVNRDSRQKCGGSVGPHQSGQQSKVCMCVHCHTPTPPPPVALPIKGVGQDPGYPVS